jgi:ribonucleoside-diphosphate reductase beta chain
MTRTATDITNARRLAFGPKDELMNMARIKYPWAIEVYDRMEANTWFPKSVPLNDDRVDYRNKLSDRERAAFDKALAFVSNLDGIQFNNLITNIGQHVTAPEVSLALARQASEEGVHVRSYQFIVEAVSLDPETIYMMFERDGMLARKNEFIMRGSRVLKDEPTPANFARAIIGNVALEGIYFYSAFLLFYIFGRSGRMLGTADMIKYINRDEGETHLDLFTSMHHAYRAENPELYDAKFVEDAVTMLREATELEIAWAIYNIDGGFPGATEQMFTGFLKGLANARARRLDLPDPFPGAQDYQKVVPWFDSFSQANGTRTNFFEGKPTEYAVDGLTW